MRLRTHTYVYIYMYTDTHRTYIHTRWHLHKQIRIHMHKHNHIHIHIRIHKFVYTRYTRVVFWISCSKCNHRMLCFERVAQACKPNILSFQSRWSKMHSKHVLFVTCLTWEREGRSEGMNTMRSFRQSCAFVSFAYQTTFAKNTVGPALACPCFRVSSAEAR